MYREYVLHCQIYQNIFKSTDYVFISYISNHVTFNIIIKASMCNIALSLQLQMNGVSFASRKSLRNEALDL